MRRQLSLHKGVCIQFVEADDGVLCALLRLGWIVFEDMWTGVSQSVGESVLTHDGFFLRSFGIEFHEVAELGDTFVGQLVWYFSLGGVVGRHVWCIPFE